MGQRSTTIRTSHNDARSPVNCCKLCRPVLAARLPIQSNGLSRANSCMITLARAQEGTRMAFESPDNALFPTMTRMRGTRTSTCALSAVTQKEECAEKTAAINYVYRNKLTQAEK